MDRKLKEKLTVEKLFNLLRLYDLYVILYSKKPEKFSDLKEMIKNEELTGYES
jgi:hypothetical protein